MNYDIEFKTVCETEIDGLDAIETTSQTIKNISLETLKDVLEYQLGVACNSNNEPYRPTPKDLEKTWDPTYHSERFFKTKAKQYQKAYDLYEKVLNEIVNSGPDSHYSFEHCKQQIDIKIYPETNEA